MAKAKKKLAKKKASSKKPARRKAKVAVRTPRGVPAKRSSETNLDYHDRLAELSAVAVKAGDTALAVRLEARAGQLASKYKAIRERRRERGAKGPGTYPWYECIDDQLGRGHTKDAANKICGSIRGKSRRKYPAYWEARERPYKEARRKARGNPRGKKLSTAALREAAATAAHKSAKKNLALMAKDVERAWKGYADDDPMEYDMALAGLIASQVEIEADYEDAGLAVPADVQDKITKIKADGRKIPPLDGTIFGGGLVASVEQAPGGIKVRFASSAGKPRKKRPRTKNPKGKSGRSVINSFLKGL